MAANRVSGKRHENGPTCSVTEFGVIGDTDIAEAAIDGRYPEQGFALNRESNMMIRVISGSGVIALRESGLELHPGDVVRVNKETPYYYEGIDLQILMICSPVWSPGQYEQVD